MPDINSLDRFIEAQTLAYPTAPAELRRGAKRTHWMWFIFPQIAGLGQSTTARHFHDPLPRRVRRLCRTHHPWPALCRCRT
ncbi:DUF1810 family protein [Sphingomonas sp. AP4-R1]|uniref:DUF1810 family protein n=1 Tax=Sphingomonas sp. AP4-R1 TaxID=2735134 RepID=UPI003463326B